MVEIKVYNAEQIGGCFTVITTSRAKIMIDYGLALPGSKLEQECFDWEKENVDAVFITHYHGDHAGKLLEIPNHIPIYMGKTTKQVMKNIHQTLTKVDELRNEQKKWVELLESIRVKEIKENTPIIDIKGIKITPYSVDHSAYDAYMYLIEADGKVILHTGDFRGHGYRGSKMTEVIKKYVHANGRKVDYLITEGTMMGYRKNEKVKTERELYEEAVELFKENRYVFLVISSTNLDSLVSFYHAAQKNKMYMYCYNYYFYKQLKTFSESASQKSPWYKFENVYTVDFAKKLSHELWDKEKTQEELMREYGFICVVKAEDKYNAWIEKFKDKNPLVIYSMWDGYIDKEKGKEAYNQEWADFFALYQKSGQFRNMHTSGHATAKMITEVIEAVDPQEAIIPMHTENAASFQELAIDEKYLKMMVINGIVADGWQKNKNDWDCRAIPQVFLEKFYSAGKYYPFVELVKKHPELEFCFRGNNYSSNDPTAGGKVCIYKNNHAMFTITPHKLYFNPNYLRYCKDWEQIAARLVNKTEYGFNGGKKIYLRDVVKTKNVKTGVVAYSCQFEKSEISVPITANLLEKLEELYKLLSQVFDDYFSNDAEKCVDRFLEWSNKYTENKVPAEYYEGHKKIKLEKIRQQQLFSSKDLQKQKNGYYFYDMEFQQKHRNKAEQIAAKQAGESNKPDMQAIRFGSDGKPEALVFVEVKCTRNAYNGESGLYKHIDAMLKYPDTALKRRRREAYLILHQYKELGLRSFERELNWQEYENLPLEILLVLTDNAKTLWEEDESLKVKEIKEDNRNKNQGEISLPDGENAVLIVV